MIDNKGPNHPSFRERLTIILSHPLNPDNIGLAARSMKNTGFRHLRLVLKGGLDPRSRVTAVHAQDILVRARIFSDIKGAVADMDCVFAAVARKRKNFPALPLDEAVDRLLSLPPSTRIGMLFGNEKSGLNSRELCHSNFRFTIPQAATQPSYNLASAVLLSLFSVFTQAPATREPIDTEKPLSREDQEECMALIIQKLEEKGFIHPLNRVHVGEMVHDLFGRLGMTPKDRNLLLAIFSKGPDALDEK